MNTDLLAVSSLAVVIALIGVLVGFVRHLTRLLRRTGDTLAAAVPVVTTIRQDCESVIAGVLTLNQNLNVAAGGLTGAVGAAQRRATSVARERVAAALAQERALADAARERAAAEAVRERAAAETRERVAAGARERAAAVTVLDLAAANAVRERAAAEAHERAAAEARERAAADAREHAAAMATDRFAAGPAAREPERATPRPTDRGSDWVPKSPR